MTIRTRYRIVAACLAAKTANSSAPTADQRSAYQLITLYAGSFLPADCPQEQVDRFLRKGAVVAEEVDE